MDIVSAVKEYSKLLNVEYHLILGRKNKAKNIRIIFDDTSWFHVAGLHYLKDIGINHDKIALKPFFYGIILGNIFSKPGFHPDTCIFTDVQVEE